eukprot:5186429-Alexandrium_andersonii.AAC.1
MDEHWRWREPTRLPSAAKVAAEAVARAVEPSASLGSSCSGSQAAPNSRAAHPDSQDTPQAGRPDGKNSKQAPIPHTGG